jgi:hypothetical protein
VPGRERSGTGVVTPDHEDLVEGLSDTLAGWWEAATGQETYAHQWTAAAEAALRIGPSRDH